MTDREGQNPPIQAGGGRAARACRGSQAVWMRTSEATRRSPRQPAPASGTEPLDGGERAGVGDDVAAGSHREIVAAVFALLPDLPADPPDRRVVEEQGLDARLHEVDEIVVPANVRELVGEQELDLIRRQSRRAR